MSNKLFILMLLMGGFSVNGQANSAITYDAGTTIKIVTGADECAVNIIINGTYSGRGTI